MKSSSRTSHTHLAQSSYAWHVWSILAALVLGGAATVLTRIFQEGRPRADLTLTIVIVMLTSSLAGAFSWWLLISRRQVVTELRGAMAGALTALLSYLLVYQVANVVYGAASPELFGQSLGARIIAGLLLSVITIVFSSWFTLPLLALIGAVLAFIQTATLPNVERGLVPRLRMFFELSRIIIRAHPLLRLFSIALGVAMLAIVVVSVWIWTRPLQVEGLVPQSTPIASHSASVAAIQQQIAQETADSTVNPVCRTRLFDNGQRSARVVVFFHGFTNCPAQFEPLAQQFVERGYNVYIPRVPHHGEADLMTEDLSNMSADELTRFADQSVDLAHGLGDQVYVVGLSGGANVAGWLAQQRSDIAQVTLIAPMINFQGLPAFATRPVASAILALPNFFLWWDSDHRNQRPGPTYTYPRYPVHAIGELLRLSFAVQDSASRTPPATKQIVVITNDADKSVSNAATASLIEQWQRDGVAVEQYSFGEQLKLPHDVIDIHQPSQNTKVVYPQVITLIDHQ